MIRIAERATRKLPGLSSLFVSFDFNQRILDEIKFLDTRIFDENTKEWEIPTSNLSQLLDTLTNLDDIKVSLLSDEIHETLIYPLGQFKTEPFNHQLEAIQFGLNHDRWLLLDAPGLGKAFTLDTQVLTSRGFKAIKDVHPGDNVFDDLGNQCNVVAEYNNENLNMYEIKFSTGQKITCCEDHQWSIIRNKPVWIKSDKQYVLREFREVLSTKELIANDTFKKAALRIPFTKPVK